MSKSNTADMLRRIEMRVAELGMTKEEFYEKSGISSASYSQWNTGTHAPTKKKMAQAAAALNVSLEYILTGETKKESTATNGSELTEEEMKFLEWFRSQASEKDTALVRMIVEGE